MQQQQQQHGRVGVLEAPRRKRARVRRPPAGAAGTYHAPPAAAGACPLMSRSRRPTHGAPARRQAAAPKSSPRHEFILTD